MIILVILVVLTLLFFALSVKKVRGDQRVLLLRFGKPKKLKKPGLRIRLKWVDEWVVYPTKEHCLAYERIKMFTKKGTWGGEFLTEYEKFLADFEKVKKEIKELEDKKEISLEEKKRLAELKNEYEKMAAKENEERERYKKKAEDYDVAEITVSATLYFWWPQEEDDIKECFKFGPSPGNPEDPKYIERLKKEFEDVIMGSLREIVGDMTWGEVISRREQIAKRLKERLMEPGSPFEKAKIKNFYIVISELDLPDDLKKLLTKRQEERLKAEAAHHVAERLRLEIGEAVGMATTTLQRYKFPQEKAQDVAVERHGDILAAREGELKRIQWMTKDGGRCASSSILNTDIAQVIAQTAVAVREILKTNEKEKKSEPNEEKKIKEEEDKPTKPEEEIEKILSQKILTKKDLARLRENLAKLPEREKKEKLRYLAKKTATGEIKVI